MNKKYKLLSLLLSTGIVASAFPSSGTGATSESIAFYNSKKSILEMKEYDEVYDTNHDGVVNVFDVIRKNKEVFQEESYTDLKSKIYSLETQIEILTQKLAEKEDKSQSESDISEIYTALSGKVDQQNGKQLSSNDYTDEEKQKLENLSNYDDTSVKSDLSDISSALSGKVDIQEGKQLSSNDYTNAEKQKLENLENYDDNAVKSDLLAISSELSEKVNIQEGKQLSSNDYTDEEKNKLASLENYNDNDIKLEISSINSELSSINYSLSGKVDQQEGKQLSSNDYTDTDKDKLKNLNNYDDTKINEKIDSLIQTAYEEKEKIESIIDNKIDKEEGKQLSSNDYTDEDKQKLENLNNYDDTDLKNEINKIKNASTIYSNHWEEKIWYAYGTSITDEDIGTGKYVSYLAGISGLNVINKGIGGGGIGDLGGYSHGQVYRAICNTTDGKLDADLITIETGANDIADEVPLGSIYDVGTDTLCGCLNDCIRYLQANTNAQIVVMPSPSTTSVPTNDSHMYYEWRLLIEQICKINSVYFIDASSNLSFTTYNSSNGTDYAKDSIHQTELGGYILAEHMWSKLKDIPLFRTELPV